MRLELTVLVLSSLPLLVGCGDDGSGEGSSGGSDSSSSGAEASTTTPTPGETGTPSTGSSTSVADTTNTTTSASASTNGDTSMTAGSSEDTSFEGPPYPPCEAGVGCPAPYDECYEFAGPNHSVCTHPCSSDADCPALESGDAIVTCAGMDGDQCLLNCAGGATCPDGMDCVDILGDGQFLRCLWPN